MLTQSQMLSKMIALASFQHANQYDKAGMPYILHCLKVMDYLNTNDLELMCIAVGHDLLEDTAVSSKDLYDLGFPPRVVQGIEDLTKVPGISYEDYVAGIKRNYDAIVVKIADLKHNSDISRLKGVTEKDIKRTVKYYELYLELEATMKPRI